MWLLSAVEYSSRFALYSSVRDPVSFIYCMVYRVLDPVQYAGVKYGYAYGLVSTVPYTAKYLLCFKLHQ